MAQLFDDYRSTYNETVQDSIDFVPLKHDFFLQAKADLLERLVKEKLAGARPVRALDVGCGVGALHPFLRNVLPDLAGCDISHESIARARQNNPSVSYTGYDDDHLPYADGRFDLAFAVCVVHHVPPANWPGFFAEMKRVVRPGGIACVIEHNPFNPLTRLAVLRCPFDADAVLIRPARAKALFRQQGFSSIESEHFLVFPTARPAFRGIERALSRVPLGAQYACSARV
jgi:SAM-dependent methyltransferase